MKRSNWLLMVALTLAACAPASAPTSAPPAPTSTVTSSEPTSTETSAPSETPASTLVPPTAGPTLAPINLAGTALGPGSTASYPDGSTLVFVPAGGFIMGDGAKDAPVRSVGLPDYWIYRTEVTNRMYALCVNAGACSPPDKKDNPVFPLPLKGSDPVVGVDYSQAAAYCGFVHARLPTEAEWEKAARGPNGNSHPWGEDAPTCSLLNFAKCEGGTTEVTKYTDGLSYYGAYDLAGNVQEWTADWYGANYYAGAPADSPAGPATGSVRSVRSSSFKTDSYLTNSARRYSRLPTDHTPDLGFRCAVDDPAYFAPSCSLPLDYGLGPAGDPKGGTPPSVTCPDVSLKQGQYCDAKKPRTTLTFKGPEGATVDPGTCVPSADPKVFTCGASVPVQICAPCSIDTVAPPGCPAGYHVSGETCVPDAGASGNCLPGSTFDAANQCCAAAPPAGDVFIPPLCPAGTNYVKSEKACLAYPTTGKVCASAKVSLMACGTSAGSSSPCDGLPIATCSSVPGCVWDLAYSICVPY